jgi:hypothetical protein
VRYLAAIALSVMSLFSSLLLLLAADPVGLIDHSIENSRKVHADFQAATRFVDAFRAGHGRLPDGEEFGTWSRGNVRSGPPLIVTPDEGAFGEEAVALLGRPPRDGYLLRLWRGEWMEYYASWSGQSTLSFNRSDYYLFGSQFLDVPVFALLACIFIVCAYRVWTGRRLVPGLGAKGE